MIQDNIETYVTYVIIFLYVKWLFDFCWLFFLSGVLLNTEQLVSIREQSGRGMTVMETVSQSPWEL